jgi:hypothetical protein
MSWHIWTIWTHDMQGPWCRTWLQILRRAAF